MRKGLDAQLSYRSELAVVTVARMFVVEKGRWGSSSSYLVCVKSTSRSCLTLPSKACICSPASPSGTLHVCCFAKIKVLAFVPRSFLTRFEAKLEAVRCLCLALRAALLFCSLVGVLSIYPIGLGACIFRYGKPWPLLELDPAERPGRAVGEMERFFGCHFTV